MMFFIVWYVTLQSTEVIFLFFTSIFKQKEGTVGVLLMCGVLFHFQILCPLPHPTVYNHVFHWKEQLVSGQSF